MRKVHVKEIKKTVSDLCIRANTILRKDIENAIRRSIDKEKDKKSKRLLGILIDNARIARKERLAICQDTGIVVCDIEIGQDVRLIGGGFKKAINEGVREGYKKGFFRKSIVKDPILRKGAPEAFPAVIHMDIVKGKRIEIIVSPKGFGSENKSRIKMFTPTADISTIKKFVVETVKEAGADACPPFIIGVGIGGTFDKAAMLSKKALYRPIDIRNPKRHIRKLEIEIMEAVSKLKIGPMGLGGRTTCLGVNILDAPTHIAGLPVAVNIGCHATRSAGIII